jgi:protein involved in sex pheromone biosynthesis
MKKLFILPVMVLFLLSSCSQFKMGQEDKIIELSSKVDSLIIRVDSLTSQNKLQET